MEELEEVPIVPTDKGVDGLHPDRFQFLNQFLGQGTGQSFLLIDRVNTDCIDPPNRIRHAKFPTADIPKDEPHNIPFNLCNP
jgi:hypothetical protein